MSVASLVAGWERLPPEMDVLPVVNAVVLACLLPVLVYRMWRWRQRRSPATALSAVAVSVLWLWVVLSWWWEMLPPLIQALEITGAPGVIMDTVILAYILTLRRASPPLHLWLVAATGFIVLAVMVVAIVVSDATSLDLHSYRFSMSHPTNTGLVVALLVANMYVAAVLSQMVWLGVRSADNTPTGWGIGLFAVGAAACLVPVVRDGIAMQGTAPGDAGYVWFKAAPAAVAVVCVVAGFTVPPLAVYAQARRKLFRLRLFRDYLISKFPSLDMPLAPGASHTDRVHEWCSQIQDGLTLIAQERQLPLQGDEPPSEFSVHAAAVIDWVLGEQSPGLNYIWLVPPEPVKSPDWLLTLADHYRRRTLDERPRPAQGCRRVRV